MLKRKREVKEGDYFKSSGFTNHRKKILNLLATLPWQEAPAGWHRRNSIAVGGLEYIGVSRDSQYLLAASSEGRGLFGLNSLELIERDRAPDNGWLDEQKLLCKGIGPIAGDTLPVVGVGGGGLPTQTALAESIRLVSPLFPCVDVVFEPAYSNCLVEGHNSGCIIVYRGFVNYAGFSFDGNTLLVVDEDIHIWQRDTTC